MFTDPGPSTPVRPLGEIAMVSSGITKGRRTSESTEPVPYLAVSNVQAGYLNLEVVKEINATDAEIERYQLAEGDLVLTEGGDPDKLGRGTIWRNELEGPVIHQNHIFRVRIDDNAGVLPEYLSAFTASSAARDFFLRSAKQTTGIASINMRQLRGLPVQVPSLSKQQLFVHRLRELDEVKGRAAVNEVEALFASLQSRAFRGEL